MSGSVSQRITQRSESNLALGFVLLPREKRRPMAVLYAFCRQVDDIADEVELPIEQRRRALEEWQVDLGRIYSGAEPVFQVNRELAIVVRDFNLPKSLFEELLTGVGMDLDNRRYKSHEDLELYCYRVASVVGLLSIEIFGYRDPACKEYAVALGKALQLTNILRDVRVDADRGRIYFPASDLDRFGVSPDEILRHEYTDRFRALAAATAERARAFYLKARESLPPQERSSMIAAEAMGAVYWRLLVRMKQSGFNTLGPNRPRLSKPEKLYLLLRTWWRIRTGAGVPNYGTP
ncbi:MAG: presqualene diphosphate synthase HpnD [Verrucomicrobiae bacterium]|nr:presqualene diphosphate synthase HpnD [Verrucomicrobiae bacterium]